MKARCVKCGSFDVSVTEEEGLSFIKCNKCGFDELEEGYFSAGKTSQKEKGKFSPYKAGGKQRSRR